MITHLKQDLILGRFPQESCPVVLACLKNHKGSKRTVAMLEQLAAKMRDHVSIIIAYEENWSRVRSEMKIDGTPTFIFFVSGQERGRILGKATSRYLQIAARQWFRDGSQSKERK